jgi:Transcriptional activator of glycolytic enzymes
MPPPPTIPSPPHLAPPGVGPPARAVTEPLGPLLPSSQPPTTPTIIVSFSGLPSHPTVSTVSSSVSAALPVAANQSTTQLTPPATSQAVSTLSAVEAAASNDDRKLAQWRAFTERFDEVRMRKHEWKYDTDYTPLYRFQQVTQICDLWTEWSTGLNGFLPVRNLDEGWGSRWRWGHRGQSTENCRRSRFVELMQKLIAKPGWDLALAQRFLRERYEGKMSPRQFCVHIQKNEGAGLQEVLQAALSYPS